MAKAERKAIGMSTLYIHTMLISIATFGTIIAIIRLQPFDDKGLRTVEHCREACFMNIAPDLSRIEQAVAIIEAHDWVEAIDGQTGTGLSWFWNGAQPAWIDGDEKGLLVIDLPGRFSLDGGPAMMIIQTNLTFGDVWLTLGPPDSGNALGIGNNRIGGRTRIFNNHIAHYDGRFTAMMPVACRPFWRQPVILVFGLEASTISYGDYMLREVRQQLCAA
ncbi:MAG: hypothetical protein D6737_02595 [Chloroflexi bacterium]|nr:MAG: hypothetical protein D6737_02595 [Chloroflexota bacterium]